MLNTDLTALSGGNPGALIIDSKRQLFFYFYGKACCDIIKITKKQKLKII